MQQTLVSRAADLRRNKLNLGASPQTGILEYWNTGIIGDLVMNSVREGIMDSATASHRGKCNPCHNLKLYFFFLILLIVFLQGYAGNSSSVNYNIAGKENQALIFKPEGTGPFPALIYNHGLIVDKLGVKDADSRGYKLSTICKTLSKNGFFVFAPIRQSGSRNIPGHKREVDRAIDYVKNLPEVDPSRIGLMGFSRGGLLTLMVAVERSDLKAYLILAPAPGRGHFARAVKQVSSLNAPVLLLVEASDDQNILEDFEMLSRALKESGKESRIIKYDRGEGHRLFWNVGYYWDDVLRFLKDNLIV